MNAQRTMLNWMEEHKCTRVRLAKDLHVGMSLVSSALNPKWESHPERYKTFWQKAQEHTGLDFGFPAKKISKELIMPNYVEVALRTFGKTVVDERIVRKYGIDRIIKYYAALGLVVKHCRATDELNTKYDYLEIVN